MTILHDKTNSVIDGPEKFATLLRDWLFTLDEIDRDKEYFFVMCLGPGNQVKAIDVVSIGDQEKTVVHPRETYRRAITLGASILVVAHNHLSGTCRPSKEDRAVTKQLTAAGKIIGIELVDHVIFTEDEYASFKDNGKI